MKRRPYHVALCGVLAALGTAIMALGTAIPIGTFCCPALCALLLIPVQDLCGTGFAMGWYAVVAVLSLLLAPDKEAAFFFLFLGDYPALRPAFQRIRARGLRLLAKLLYFNAAIACLYGLLYVVTGASSLGEEFGTTSRAVLAAILAVGNLTFVLYDLVLFRMTALWKNRLRKRLVKD